MSQNLIATCAFGLESVVRRELEDLGISASILQPGWVGFTGGFDLIARTNLALRSADRVLIEVASFAAEDFDQLFETTRALPWDQFIPAYARFPVKGRSVNSTLSSIPACQRSVKKAIVEGLKRGHSVEELPENGPLYQIEIALRNNQARLTLDTTGPSLHKRGYRHLVGEAPLKETLAAAMILLSVWDPQRPLIDPFCGSGTIPIEAAMIARDIAPGLKRSFAFEDWPTAPAAECQAVREEFLQRANDSTSQPDSIIGTDIDGEVLSLARKHAEEAGVADVVHFQQRDFADLRSKREYGCLIANPPYGERLESPDLNRLYQGIPRILQRLTTWSHFILTSYPRFEAVVQKSATRRRKLFNGRIECMYYQYLGPRPPKQSKSDDPHLSSKADEGPKEEERSPSLKSAGVFGGLSDKSLEQAELFGNRLRKRARHLRRWPARGISCFRLYEKDIPEIPLIVDRYDQHLHIVEVERPHSHDAGEHAAWQDLMCKQAAKTLEINISRVHFKERSRQRRSSQHQKVDSQNSEVLVEENGLQFLVNLSDYADTGLFLDHRIAREKVRNESSGRNVLNLFGYTGAFTVNAAIGKAKSTVHVDLSKTYVEWARKNMSINRFHGPQYQFVTADAVDYLQSLPEKPMFDLAIVDPPTFSNSKKTEGIWDVQKDYLKLLQDVSLRLSEEGILYFSTNFRRFKFDDQVVADLSIFRFCQEISSQTVPEDFRNKRIHRCWRMVK